ncbi:pilus assembly protein [Methylocystis echinoides]|uniref:pilus assembly protein n=1 Tax=Methylocystis echinoides TaxID=29468 RepID=UPI00343D6047
MDKILRRFVAQEGGSTFLEYAVIAAFVAIAIVAGASSIGVKLSATYLGSIAPNL